MNASRPALWFCDAMSWRVPGQPEVSKLRGEGLDLSRLLQNGPASAAGTSSGPQTYGRSMSGSIRGCTIHTLIMYFDMHPAGRMPGTREIFAHTWAMYSYTNAAGPGHDLHHLSKAQGLTGMCVCSPGSLAACTGISSDQKRCHGIILAAIPPEDNAMQEFPCGTGTP